MYITDPEYVKSKYNLVALREVENLVADAVQISVPFNNVSQANSTFISRYKALTVAGSTLPAFALSLIRPVSMQRLFSPIPLPMRLLNQKISA